MTPKLLVVDDEPATVDMITTFLEINNFEYASAYNGTDGLILLEAEAPDMLIVDLMMPDIQGFEVCRQMRAMPQFQETPIVMISARVDPEAKQEAIRAGANEYLTKPLDLRELLRVIRQLTMIH